MADLTWVKTLKIDARGRKSPKIAENRRKRQKSMRARAKSGRQVGYKRPT
jgi:hypothetical protein